LPTADVDSLRKAQSERIQQMRGKLWTEIAGRADPSNPSADPSNPSKVFRS
jgi:hypothetical protein